MKAAFTLIEILITLILLSLVMGIVVPSGVKLLDQFSLIVKKQQEETLFQLKRANAFAASERVEALYLGKRYTIKPNGILLYHEQ